MLAGMVLIAAVPAVMTGKRILDQKQNELRMRMLGDSMYETIQRQLQDAERIVIGTEEVLETVEEEYPMYLWEPCVFPKELKEFEWMIVLEHAEPEWIYFGVQISEDGIMIYERDEHIPMLNFSLCREEETILEHGSISWESEEGIWYGNGI